MDYKAALLGCQLHGHFGVSLADVPALPTQRVLSWPPTLGSWRLAHRMSTCGPGPRRSRRFGFGSAGGRFFRLMREGTEEGSFSLRTTRPR